MRKQKRLSRGSIPGKEGAASGKASKSKGWAEIIARHSAMMALEPRFMFDAAVAATADAVADKAADAQADAGLASGPDVSGAGGTDARPGQAAAGDADPAVHTFMENMIADFDGSRDGGEPGLRLMSGGYEPPENEAPTISGGDSGFTVPEDVRQALGGLSVGDFESDTLRVTLSVGHGKLYLTQSDGITVTGDFVENNHNNGATTITLVGDPTQINEALASLKYQGDQDWNSHDTGFGPDTLRITVIENDSTTAAGHEPVTKEIAIDVTAVNDVPRLTLPGLAQEIPEDTLRTITGLRIDDPDIGDVVSVRLNVEKGALSFGSDVLAVTRDANGYSFAGSLDQVNEMLAGLKYQGNQDYYGSDKLTVNYRDAGGAWLADPAEVEIKVTSVNDAPTISPPADPAEWLGVLEGGEGVLKESMFNLRDVDNTAEQFYIKLTAIPDPAKGKLQQKMGSAWVDMVVGSNFSLQDVIDGKIKYVHAGSQVRDEVAAGSERDSFSFTVNDGADGWAEYDGSREITLNVNLLPVNQAPDVVIGGGGARTEVASHNPDDGTAINRLVVYEGEDKAVLKFSVVDPDQADGVPHSVNILTLPKDGYLSYKGTRITLENLAYINTLVTLADIGNGDLTYTHNGNDGGQLAPALPMGATRRDGFDIRIIDDGGGAGTPKTVDKTIDIAVRPNNDHPYPVAPMGTGDVAGEVMVGGWGDYVLGKDFLATENLADQNNGASWGGLNVRDVDSLPSAITYKITQAPANGTLYYKTGGSYQPLGVGASFTQADVDAGRIVYRYSTGLNSEASPTVHNGIDNLAVTVRDGSLTAWGRDALEQVHENDPKYEGGIGEWKDVDGVQTWVLTPITVKLNVKFTETGTGESVPVDIIGPRDILPGGDRSVEVHEGGRADVKVSDLTAQITYTKNSVLQTEVDPTLRYRIIDNVTHGSLFLREYTRNEDGSFKAFTGNVVQLSIFSTFTQADLNNDAVFYQHNGEEAFSDDFSVTISDGVKETNGIKVNVHVNPANDTPDVHGVEGGPLTVREGAEPGQDGEDGFDRFGVPLTPDKVRITDADGTKGQAESGFRNGYDDPNDLAFVVAGKPAHGSIWVYVGPGGPPRYDNASQAANNAAFLADVAAGKWREAVYASETADTDNDGLADLYDVAKWNVGGDLQNHGLENGSGGTVDVLTMAQLANGSVRYIHDGNDAFYDDVIRIVANDGKGVPHGGRDIPGSGVADDPAAMTARHGSSISAVGEIQVKITPVNDAPRLVVNNPLESVESAALNPTNYNDPGVGTIITGAHLKYSDHDSSNVQLQYRITSETKNGTVYLWDTADNVWKALGKTSVFTQADVDAGRVKYVHNGTETHADSFTFTLSDGDTGKEVMNRDQVFVIAMTPANNPPTLDIDRAKAGPEEDGVIYLDNVNGKNLGGVFHIDDRDYHENGRTDAAIGPGVDKDEITVTISARRETGDAPWGRLGFSSAPSGVVHSGEGGDTITITGTLADVNAALMLLVYKPPAGTAEEVDIDEKVTITAVVSDLGNGDPDQNNAKTVSGSIDLFVSPWNDTPTQTGARPGNDPSFILGMNEDDRNIDVKNGALYIHIDDPDAFSRNINTITLSVEHGRLSIATSIGGVNLLKDGANNSKTITLQGTRENINKALETLKYTPTAEWNGKDNLHLSYDDGNSSGEWGTGEGGQKHYEADVKILVKPVNDAPTLEVPLAPVAVSAGADYTYINSGGGIKIDDPKDFKLPDGDNRNHADGGMWDYDKASGSFRNDVLEVTLSTVQHGTAGAYGLLRIDAAGITGSLADPGGVTGNGTDTIVLKGTRAEIDTALRTLAFSSGESMENVQVDLKIHVNDLGNGDDAGQNALTADGSVLLLVSSNNTAPVVTGPASVTLDEDASIKFSGVSPLSVYDADAMDYRIKIELSVEHGALKLDKSLFKGADTVVEVTETVGGKTYVRGYVITASQAKINSALAGLTYTADPDFNGADRLTIGVDDQNNFSANPASTAQTASGYVDITVNPVNDAPLVVGKDTPVAMTPVLEDVSKDGGANPGQKISDLFGGSDKFDDGKDEQYDSTNTTGSRKNAFAGIAVVGNTANGATQGEWQYYDAGQGKWVNIGARSDGAALFLDGDTMIRFQPVANYNGTPPDLAVRLVDSSAADAAHGNPGAPGANMSVHDLSGAGKVGGNTCFSADTAKLRISVTAVNDAPTVVNPGTVTRSINEDPATNDGETVTSLFNPKFNDNLDQVAGGSSKNTLLGVVVTKNEADPAGEGEWQYWNGSIWVDIGGRSESTALFLAAGTKIRFQPAGDYYGTPPSLEVRLVDNSDVDLPNGNPAQPANFSTVDLTATGVGGTTRYSADHAALTMTVNPVNDAPVITNPATPVTMNPVSEDVTAAANSGQKVSDLFGPRFDDTKESARVAGSDNGLAGIVVVGNPATAKGEWQYWNGGSWAKIPTGVSDAAGVFLSAGTDIRFQPAPDYNGEPPRLTVRLVDDSPAAAVTPAAPANGGTVDVSGARHGGATRYSDQTVDVAVSVTPVNDAPVAKTPNDPVAMTPVAEDVAGTTAANPGQTVSELFGGRFDDSTDQKYHGTDNPQGSTQHSLAGVVVVSNTADPATEGAWQYFDAASSTWVDIGSRNASNGLFLDAGTSIRFQPVADYNGTPPSLSVRLADTSADAANPALPANKAEVDLGDPSSYGGATRYSADTAKLSIAVNPANDAPVAVVDGTHPAPRITIAEDPAANPGKSVFDLFKDNFSDPTDAAGNAGANGLAGAVVVLNNAISSTQGKWEYFNTATNQWTDIGTRSAASGLFLANDTLIRFNPVQDYNGTPPALVVHLADDFGAPGQVPADHSVVNLAGDDAIGGSTRYTAGTVTLSVEVTPVNDRPAIAAPPSVSLSEDGTFRFDGTAGKSVAFDDIDIKRGEGTDSVTVTLSVSNGSIKLIGGTASLTPEGGTDFSSDASATLKFTGSLADVNNAMKNLVYTPAAGFNGNDSLDIVVNDNGNAGAGGPLTEVASVGLQVASVNNAPVAVIDGAHPEPAVIIPEDPTDAQNPGSKVRDLFGGNFSDPGDAGSNNGADALAGIVVVGNTATDKGEWQYWNGGAWAKIPTGVSDTNGVFIAAGTEIRFKPAQDYNGTPPSLTVRLADDGGDSVNPAVPATNGAAVDVSGAKHGGHTRYSADTIELGAKVNAINDAPTRTGPEVVTRDAVNVDAANTQPGETVASLFGGKFSDARDGQHDAAANPGGSARDGFAGVVVTGTVDSQYGDWQYSDDNGQSWHNIAISADGSDCLILAPDALLRFIPDANTVMNGQPVPGYLTVRLIEDSSGAVTTGATAAIGQVNADPVSGRYSDADNQIRVAVGVIGNNSAPDVAGLAPVNATERQPAQLAPAGNLTDRQLDDSNVVGNWGGATLTIQRQGAADPHDVFGSMGGLGSLIQGGALTLNGETIGAVTRNSGGVLVLTFNANADPGKVDLVLQGLTYTIDHHAPPASVTLEYTVDDGNPLDGPQGKGSAMSKTVTQLVNIAPVLENPTAHGEHETIALDQTLNGTVSGRVTANDIDWDETGSLRAKDHAGLPNQCRYGALVIGADGTYTYTVDPNNADVKAMKPGETLTETVSYKVVNADGRESLEVTLTIVIRNDNFIPVVDPGEKSVHVEDLPKDDGGNRGLKGLEVTKPVVENVARANHASDQRISDNIRSFGSLTSGWSLSSLLDRDGGEWSSDITLTAKLDSRNLFVDMKEEFTLPNNLFVHSDPSEKLTLTAMLADGSPLPDWMQFDPDTYCVTCHAPAGQEGALDVMILAEDTKGRRARAVLNIKLVKEESGKDGGEAVPPEKTGDEPEEIPAEGDGGTEELAAVEADDLALLREWRLAEEAEAGRDAVPGVHPGLERQIAGTGSTRLLADARAMARELAAAD